MRIAYAEKAPLEAPIEPLIHMECIKRLVQEITNDHTDAHLRMQDEARIVLQVATEAYLASLFEDVELINASTKHVPTLKKSLMLAQRICGGLPRGHANAHGAQPRWRGEVSLNSSAPVPLVRSAVRQQPGRASGGPS
jgi:histone H3/H4